MPKMLRLPPTEKLPHGVHRAFVEELFMYYREAGRPQLRVIATWIKDHQDDLRGTASTETIRRVLTGTTVPRVWLTVEAVLEALCGIAGRNPDAPRSEYGHYGRAPLSCRDELMRLWNAMLDDYQENDEMPALPPIAQPRPPHQRQDFDDPWATAPAPARSASRSSFDDEPPF